eukprot:735957-Rhodomonas_salina.1
MMSGYDKTKEEKKRRETTLASSKRRDDQRQTPVIRYAREDAVTDTDHVRAAAAHRREGGLGRTVA